MKFKPKNKIASLLIASTLLVTSLPAFALKDDTSQPIKVTSEKQALDMNGNTVTFTDNVVIKQGTIEIHADKVIVTRPNGDQNKTVIEGFGNPITFTQKQDNGESVKGQGQTLRYEVANEFVVLTGNASLKQLDSSIHGDKITYLVQQQKMEAFSNKGKHVTTILLPAQLQGKEQTNDVKKNAKKKSN